MSINDFIIYVSTTLRDVQIISWYPLSVVGGLKIPGRLEHKETGVLRTSSRTFLDSLQLVPSDTI